MMTLNYLGKNSLRPVSAVVSALGYVMLASDLVSIPSALNDWTRILPFPAEYLPKFLCLGLVVYGIWPLVLRHVLAPHAHKLPVLKTDRITFVEFAAIAHEHGWWAGSDSLEQLDLIDGIGQAAADGTVQIYGRDNAKRYTSLRTIYIVPIGRNFWRRNHIDAFDTLMGRSNLHAVSRPYEDRKMQRFMDLHLNRIQALAWLAGEGRSWKGRTKRQEKRESALSAVA